MVTKLADFGLAKLKNEVTNYSHLTKDQGTFRKMAPKALKINTDNGEHWLVVFPTKVDVCSFGLVGFEILTRMMPFLNVKMSKFNILITNPQQ
jgi:serine/threonine protein kinase